MRVIFVSSVSPFPNVHTEFSLKSSTIVISKKIVEVQMLFCSSGVVPQVKPLLLQLPTVQTSLGSIGCDPNFKPLIGRLFLSPCHSWLGDDRLQALTCSLTALLLP